MTAFAGILGVVAGFFGAYFFTRQPLIVARQQLAEARQQSAMYAAEIPKLQSAVAAAQSTANQALGAGHASQACCDAVTDRPDKMYTNPKAKPSR